ncbi:MAG: hypothetical protein HC796_03720 [Synechococcaceae cyanobacterium RL_1_2]|nr:hypothetical protein [Synechococcaceae cyanobacterium RL_1_2]
MELGVYVPDLLKIGNGVKTLTQSPNIPFNLNTAIAQGQNILTTGTNAGQAAGLLVVIPDLKELISLKNLSFADIIRGIRAGIDFLNQSLNDEPFYTTPIPLIDKSLKNTFTFLDDIAAKIQQVADNPAGAIQQVESLIESTLGITDNNSLAPLDQKFALYLNGEFLNIHLGWGAVLEQDFGFALNLTDFPGGSALEGISSLVDINGGTKIKFKAQADLNFDIAISFTSLINGNPQILLQDYDSTTGKGTHAKVGITLAADNIDLGFKLGPINFGTTGGSLLLDDDGDRNTVGIAGLLVAIDQNPNTTGDTGYFDIINESLSNNFQIKVTGGFDLNLPLYIDFLGLRKDIGPLSIATNKAAYGDQALWQLFKHIVNAPDKGTANPVIFTAPNIKEVFALLGGDFSVLAILNDPSFILDGIETALSILEETMDSNLAQDIPLIGDSLGRGATFIRDIRQGVLADLRKN